jgi:hypothetical protein
MSRSGFVEKHYRVAEVAELTGLAVATIRKRIARREVGFSKGVRAITIPESEVRKLLGVYHQPVAPETSAPPRKTRTTGT